jgi:hypothetical protein
MICSPFAVEPPCCPLRTARHQLTLFFRAFSTSFGSRLLDSLLYLHENTIIAILHKHWLAGFYDGLAFSSAREAGSGLRIFQETTAIRGSVALVKGRWLER